MLIRKKILDFSDACVALGLRFVARCFFSKQLLELCSTVDKKIADYVTDPHNDFEVLVEALIAAEDRRFLSHSGIDLKALLRACVMLVRSKEIQGGSTITQQLVRVMTGDYRYSLRRKFKEMCLACELDSLLSKHEQAKLYLRCAYFGWQMNGLSQARAFLGGVRELTPMAAASLVARLRYPQPKDASDAYFQKLHRRANYVVFVMNLQRSFDGRVVA